MPLLLFCAAASAAEWTIGVYMCADNGMNDQSYRDIAEMAAVGSTPEVNIVVQVDRAARDSAPGCRRWLVRQGRLELLRDLGEVDMADPVTLGAFGSFLGEEFPARNCLLVLWDHGTGWGEGYGPSAATGQKSDRRLQTAGVRTENPGPRAPTDAIFIDESHRHMMGVAGGELAAALAAFQDGWGKRVSVLGFDACFMGMVEVACEAIGRADVMLAAEGLVPVQGWPYTEMLGRLAARPTTPPAEFVTAACADYVAGYPEDTVELAAIDLAKLDRLMPALAEAVAGRGGDSLLRAGRARVQTFSSNGARPPCSDDEQVDLAHLWDLAGGPESLRTRLAGAVVARAGSGGYLANARGLACWFPSRYLSLKSLHGSYAKLSFAARVGWTAMLNRWFGADDIKPGQPELARHRFGRHGDLRLWWHSTPDLAPVSYSLYQSQAAVEVLSDECEDLDGWIAVGWTPVNSRFRSGARSFFSGTGPGLDHFIESVEATPLPEGGLLSLYTWYQTLESEDSTGFARDIVRVEWANRRGNWRALDSLYGTVSEWRERRYVLPASDSVYLRIRFTTGGAAGGAGCFIDDIKVYALPGLGRVAAALQDTSFALTGLARNLGGYSYFVTATDSFGNVSSASEFYDVAVNEYAEPYTMPAPFSGQCRLVLDFPAAEDCRVSIYTLSGSLVRRFDEVSVRELAWDGRNEHGRELANGVYLVLVEADGFSKLGRIARAGD